jgi:hypothetical protein
MVSGRQSPFGDGLQQDVQTFIQGFYPRILRNPSDGRDE